MSEFTHDQIFTAMMAVVSLFSAITWAFLWKLFGLIGSIRLDHVKRDEFDALTLRVNALDREVAIASDRLNRHEQREDAAA